MLPLQNINWQERAEAFERRCFLLEDELANAKEKIRQLSGTADIDPMLGHLFGLPPSEAVILAMLMAKVSCTREQFMGAIYDDPDDAANIKIIDVFVCRLRKIMTTHGIVIDRIWGQGYFMTQENKDKCRALIAARKEERGC